MAEITPANVGRLLEQTRRHREAQALAAAERDVLDKVLLDVARQSKVGLRELAAVTGMHPSTIRAGIQRAAGPATIDFEQPELDLMGIGDSTRVEQVVAMVHGAFPGSGRNAARAGAGMSAAVGVRSAERDTGGWER